MTLYSKAKSFKNKPKIMKGGDYEKVIFYLKGVVVKQYITQ